MRSQGGLIESPKVSLILIRVTNIRTKCDEMNSTVGAKTSVHGNTCDLALASHSSCDNINI